MRGQTSCRVPSSKLSRVEAALHQIATRADAAVVADIRTPRGMRARIISNFAWISQKTNQSSRNKDNTAPSFISKQS
jgi:hypothetical protein